MGAGAEAALADRPGTETTGWEADTGALEGGATMAEPSVDKLRSLTLPDCTAPATRSAKEAEAKPSKPGRLA
jgi:hypothetical protein